MRWFICFVVLCIPLFGSAQDSSVELLGVTVSRGMTKSYLSSVLPGMSCSDLSAQYHGSFAESCSVSDGIPPVADGDIKFEKGVVVNASKYWFFPEDAKPFEVFVMLNQIITRIAGENRAVCAKIEANPEKKEGTMHTPGATQFVFPEKVLTIYLHRIKGEHVYIREGLRVNPVPDTYEVYGRQNQGMEWCGFVN